MISETSIKCARSVTFVKSEKKCFLIPGWVISVFLRIVIFPCNSCWLFTSVFLPLFSLLYSVSPEPLYLLFIFISLLHAHEQHSNTPRSVFIGAFIVEERGRTQFWLWNPSSIFFSHTSELVNNRKWLHLKHYIIFQTLFNILYILCFYTCIEKSK